MKFQYQLWVLCFLVACMPQFAHTQDQIADLELWLAADDGIEFSSGNSVATWMDKSPNGRNAFQSSVVAQPRQAGDRIKFLSFDGEDDSLDVDLAFLANSQYTVFCVASSNTEQYPHYIISTEGQIVNGAFNFGFPAANVLRVAHWFNDMQVELLDGESEQKMNILMTRLTDQSTAGQALWFNGDRRSLRSPGVLLDSVGQGQIGAGSHPSWYFRGGIAEIIIYSRSLSSNEIDFVHNYLSVKYHIEIEPTTTLPAISPPYDRGGLSESFSGLIRNNELTIDTATLPFVTILADDILTTDSIFYLYGGRELSAPFSITTRSMGEKLLTNTFYAESDDRFAQSGSVILNANFASPEDCPTSSSAYLLYRPNLYEQWALEAQTFLVGDCETSFSVNLRNGFFGLAIDLPIMPSKSSSGIILD